MKTPVIVFVVLTAATALVRADGPPPFAGPKDELVWLQPPATPPVVPRGPVRARIAGDPRARAAPSGELAGLRAVSLRDGSAVVAIAGAQRAIVAGDRIGSTRVKAIGSDRIVLEQEGAPGTGSVTLVVTFAPSGEARVRTYASMGARTVPPEVR